MAGSVWREIITLHNLTITNNEYNTYYTDIEPLLSYFKLGTTQI